MSAMSDEGLAMFAACVEQNTRDAAFTTDRLIESEKAISRSLALALLTLWDAVEESAQVVTTRKIDAALFMARPALSTAEHILNPDTN